ncbi:MAG: cytochrome c [Chitinophagaceae bacterium]|nr:cytochrome c [Chitinophagaceae bacterium]
MRALKIIGIILGMVVIILIAFALYIDFRGIPHYKAEDPGITVPPDSAMQENGKRLASMLCQDCHYSAATDRFTGRNLTDAATAQFGTLYSQNITQDKDYGIGNWTDGQILWLLRTGILRNGRYAPPYMPKLPNMSDYDIKSIIVFLRSNDPWVAPAAVPDTQSTPSFLTKFLSVIAFKPLPYPTSPISGPDTTNAVALGKYIVTGMLDCYPCHSADFKTMNVAEPEKSKGFMGGGNMVGVNLEGQNMQSANLTPDLETGIGKWTEEQFVKCIRYGQKPDGTQLSYPMVPLPQLTDREARSIFAYLMQLPPIKNKVVNPVK